VDVFWGVALPLILAFAALSFVGAFAAHINTYADYELDQKDDTKKKLTAAMSQLGKGKLKTAMIIEVAISLMFILALSFLQAKPVLLLMWMAAVFLAFAYSAKSLRLKSHSFFAVLTLLIVLSILPVTFVTYVLTSRFDLAFLLFLAGQALTVYGVIVPAEIRDYFGDKAAGANTMTVRLGLIKASVLGLGLLNIGAILCGVGFVLKLASTNLPFLSGFLIVMAAGYLFILSKYARLYRLSKQLQKKSEDNRAKYCAFSSRKPQMDNNSYSNDSSNEHYSVDCKNNIIPQKIMR
jgi:4-hydroxybenzoate polyprenyltransferase